MSATDVSSDVKSIRVGIPILSDWEHEPMCQTTFAQKGLPCNCQVARSAEALAALDRLAARAAGRENVTEALRHGVHADDDKWDGYDGSGVHSWQPGEPGDCRICAALDEAGEGEDVPSV